MKPNANSLSRFESLSCNHALSQPSKLRLKRPSFPFTRCQRPSSVREYGGRQINTAEGIKQRNSTQTALYASNSSCELDVLLH